LKQKSKISKIFKIDEVIDAETKKLAEFENYIIKLRDILQDKSLTTNHILLNDFILLQRKTSSFRARM
jgi:hypothetical protein